MNTARIEIINPTARAIERMRNILFRPFDLAKWLALGFSAWLAKLVDGGYSAGGRSSTGGGSGDSGADGGDPKEVIRDALDQASAFVMSNLDWILPLIVLVVAIGIGLLWLSSRGKFMFLDNVVHDRSLVRQPWQAFAGLANSLFWWRLVLHLAAFLLFLVILGVPAWFLFTTFDAGNIQPEWVAGAVAAGLTVLLAVFVLGYIVILLEDFVIPVMYKRSLNATAAWGYVFGLHGEQPLSFVLYALWRVLLSIASGVLILVLVLLTCCMGGILLAIPYVGAVLLLPVTVFFRVLGLEYLRQFGPEVDVWEQTREPPPLDGTPSLP